MTKPLPKMKSPKKLKPLEQPAPFYILSNPSRGYMTSYEVQSRNEGIICTEVSYSKDEKDAHVIRDKVRATVIRNAIQKTFPEEGTLEVLTIDEHHQKELKKKKLYHLSVTHKNGMTTTVANRQAYDEKDAILGELRSADWTDSPVMAVTVMEAIQYEE